MNRDILRATRTIRRYDPTNDQATSSRIRRFDVLMAVKDGHSLTEALQMVGVSLATYRGWRDRHKDWAAEFDAARESAKGLKPGFDGSFVSFRKHYLDTKTPGFQAAVSMEIERAEPGEVTMILMPPEHGKTTLLEDWCTYKLCTDNQYRITVASANVEHPKKVLARVRGRLEADGPFPDIVDRYGPFAPDGLRTSQVWGQHQWNIRQRRSDDERDYSMKAIGVTGSVQGTRCDLLLVDDVQSLKNLDQTEKILEVLRQDFLSRPSVFGRTVIIGTRVGEFDVYRRLLDEDVIDRYINFPAYSISESPLWPAPATKPKRDLPETHPPEGMKFLWPERYDDYQYAALRYRVGETAWARNYMQHPEAAAKMTFDEATTTAMRDETRSVIADPRPLDNGDQVPVIISVDPAIGGGNGTLVAAMRPDRLEVLACRLDFELTKYSQILDIIEEYCHRYSTSASFVSTLVVEDKAFQRGLLKDDRTVEVANRFGLRIVPNTTGREKADPDIGIPSMPVPMQRGQITIPWADEVSQEAMMPLLDHLNIWRPNVDVRKLPQDMVMALWFAFRQWRAVRNTRAQPQASTSSWSTRGSPMRTQVPRPLHHGQRRPYRSLSTYRGHR